MSSNFVRHGVLNSAGHDHQRIHGELARWSLISGYKVTAEIATFARFIGFESKARLAGREVAATTCKPATRRTAA
jgi:hypothetical protein